MTKREAEMLAKNWRLGNRNRKKSLAKKYDLKTATSGNTGRVKMGIRIDIENNPRDYRPALDDDGNLVFFTGKPMKRVQVSDLFVPPKARKENMINHKLEMLKTLFKDEDVSILEQFLDKHDIDVKSYSVMEIKENFKLFSERTQFQLVAQKKDGTELKSNFYNDENELSELIQKCEDSDEYESQSVVKRIVDTDEDTGDEKVNEHDRGEKDKEELYRLTTLALKQVPHSPKQKATIKKLNVLRKLNGMKPLKEKEITVEDVGSDAVAALGIGTGAAAVGAKKAGGAVAKAAKFLTKPLSKDARDEKKRKDKERALGPFIKVKERLEDEISDMDEKIGIISDKIRREKESGNDKKKILTLQLQKSPLLKKKENLQNQLDSARDKLANARIKYREKTQGKIKTEANEQLKEELRSSQNTKTKKVGSIKSIKKNARSLPLSRDYILSNEGEVRPMPMRTQMSAAMKMTNYDHPKYGSGFEIETKKGMVLIKPEVAELYMKSRDRLPDPIKKNMDRMAERSPDGLFTVLQAALNDLQTGMIESVEKVLKEAVKPDAFVKGGSDKIKQNEVDRMLGKIVLNKKLQKELENNKAYKQGFKSKGKKKNPFKKDTVDFHLFQLGAQEAGMDEVQSHRYDGRKKQFREKIKKLGYVKEKNLTTENKKALQKKAEKSGMPFGILKQVYNRGMAAWKTGHRPGTTPQQWGLARVNSFTTKSKGTWGGADKDLAAKVRGK